MAQDGELLSGEQLQADEAFLTDLVREAGGAVSWDAASDSAVVLLNGKTVVFPARSYRQVDGQLVVRRSDFAVASRPGTLAFRAPPVLESREPELHIQDAWIRALSPTQVILTWRTNRPSSSWAFLPPRDLDGRGYGHDGLETTHEVVIDGLQPGPASMDDGQQPGRACVVELVSTVGDSESASFVLEFQLPPLELAISNVQVLPTSTTSVTVSWDTNQASSTRLQVERLQAGSDAPVLEHEVSLAPLQEGRSYVGMLHSVSQQRMVTFDVAFQLPSPQSVDTLLASRFPQPELRTVMKYLVLGLPPEAFANPRGPWTPARRRLEFGYFPLPFPGEGGIRLLRELFNLPEERAAFRESCGRLLRTRPEGARVNPDWAALLEEDSPDKRRIPALVPAELCERFIGLVQGKESASFRDWVFKYLCVHLRDKGGAPMGEVRDDWRRCLTELLSRPASRVLQLHMVSQWALPKLLEAARDIFQLRTVRGVGLLFDSFVQTGGTLSALRKVATSVKYQRASERERLGLLRDAMPTPELESRATAALGSSLLTDASYPLPPGPDEPLRQALLGIGLEPEYALKQSNGRSYRLIDLLKDKPVLTVPTQGPKVRLLQLIYRALGFEIPDGALGIYDTWQTICATRALMAIYGVGWEGQSGGKDSDVGPIMWPKIHDLITRLGRASPADRAQQRNLLRQLQSAKERQAQAWEEEAALRQRLRETVEPEALARSPDAALLRPLTPERIRALRAKLHIQSSDSSRPLRPQAYNAPEKAWLTFATGLNFISYLEQRIPDDLRVRKAGPTAVTVRGFLPGATATVSLDPRFWSYDYMKFVATVAALGKVFTRGALAQTVAKLGVSLRVLEGASADSASTPVFGGLPTGSDTSHGIYLQPAALVGSLLGKINMSPNGPLEQAALGSVAVGAYAALADDDVTEFGGAYLEAVVRDFFEALCTPVVLLPPPVSEATWKQALGKLEKAKKAYDDALKKVEEEEEALQKQLAVFGQALTLVQLGKYVAAFQKSPTHNKAFGARAAALEKLSQVLESERGPLEQAAASSRVNAALLYESLKIVASRSTGSQVVLAYLTDASIEGSALQRVAVDFPRWVEDLTMPVVADAAVQSMIEAGDPTTAWERFKERTDLAMLLKDLAEGPGDIRQAWGDLDKLMKEGKFDVLLEKSREWADEGPQKKVLAVVCIVYTLGSGYEKLSEQKYAEATKDLSSGSKDLAEAIACAIKVWGDQGKLARYGSRFAIRLVPYLGVAANAASFVAHLQGEKNLGVAIAMVGDVIAFVGSCVACVPPLAVPGELIDAVGTLLSTSGDLLSEFFKKGELNEEMLRHLSAAGITGQLAKTMIAMERKNVKSLRDMKFKPEDIQKIALQQPAIVTHRVELEPLGRLLRAFSMGFEQFLSFMKHVDGKKEEALVQYQPFFGFVSRLSGPWFEEGRVGTPAKWLAAIQESQKMSEPDPDTFNGVRRAEEYLGLIIKHGGEMTSG